MRENKLIIIRSGIVVAAFIITTCTYSLLWSSPAHALSLPPLASAEAKVPLGDVLTPVTSLTNPVTDSLPAQVSIQSTPNTLGATAAVPAVSPKAAPLVNVAVPLSNPAPAVTHTLSHPISLASVPSSQSSDPVNSTVEPTATTSTNNSSPNGRPTSADNQASHPKQPLIGKFGAFFGSTLPNAIRDLTSGIAGKNVSTLPIVVSFLILLLTMVTAGGMVYASNRSGVITLGRIGQINLAKLTESHDVAQIGVLILTTICFGIVASFLALTGL